MAVCAAPASGAAVAGPAPPPPAAGPSLILILRNLQTFSRCEPAPGNLTASSSSSVGSVDGISRTLDGVPSARIGKNGSPPPVSEVATRPCAPCTSTDSGADQHPGPA